MGKKKHLPKYKAGKHKEVAALEGGSCLAGTCRGTYVKKSCSYRWQSLEESKASRTSVYNKDPKWQKIENHVLSEREKRHDKLAGEMLGTSSYWTKKRKRYPGNYSFQIALPEHKGDWYVGGPLKDRSLRKVGSRGYVPKGRNFEQMLWPYWNNAHHIIPKGTLNSSINDAKAVPNFRTRALLKGALLKAEYNVNHFKNVMLLPMDKEVAIVLKLPRHLVLEDETTIVEATAKFDHVGYNNTIKKSLRRVILDYSRTCDQELSKTCVEPSFSLSKRKLEKLSKTAYDAIIAFAKDLDGRGRPISEMPPL